MEDLTKSLEEEIERIKDMYQKKIDELQAKLLDQEKVEKKFQRMQETIKEKEDRIVRLEKSIKQMERIHEEAKQKAERLKQVEADLTDKKNLIASKDEKIKELEDRIKELEFKNSSLIERYERELESTKRIYGEQQKTSLKGPPSRGAGSTTQLILHYSNKNFIRVMSKPAVGCYLELDQPNARWILNCELEPNLVERRTAERQARSIARVGYVDGGRRVGVNYRLEIVNSGEDVPEKLTRDQHQYMK
ncbi:MAG: hypothetical protein ACTSRW_02775 [Candidatus Helarchaeota archaeon]